MIMTNRLVDAMAAYETAKGMDSVERNRAAREWGRAQHDAGMVLGDADGKVRRDWGDGGGGATRPGLRERRPALPVRSPR